MDRNGLLNWLFVTGWLIAIFVSLYAVYLHVRLTMCFQQVMDLMAKNKDLRELAVTDELTGVGSRHYYVSESRRMIARALRSGESLAMLIVDVNELKALNSRFGNPGADQVLRKLGEVLRGAFRPTDLVCRIGGDEFVVLLSNANLEGARSAVARFAGRVQAARVKIGEIETGFSVSIGGTIVTVARGEVYLGERVIGQARDPDILTDVAERLYQSADRNVHKAKVLKADRKNPAILR